MDKITLLILLAIICAVFALVIHRSNADYERRLRQKDRMIDRKNAEIENLKKELMRK